MEDSLRARLSRAGATGAEVREAARAGTLRGHTSGLAPGYAQANLVMLPEPYALAFLTYCIRNPKPCPLLEVTEVGVWEASAVAPGSDLRKDLPRYRVWRDGVLAEECNDVTALVAGEQGGATRWVSFLLGCSFSFEEALLSAGLPVRHLEQEKEGAEAEASAAGGELVEQERERGGRVALARNPRNVPMYRTNLETAPAPPFGGPLVVSMRPMTPAQAVLAAEVTAAFPRVHGRPVFAGDAAAIGIHDLAAPHYGDAVTIRAGEVPVLWACGVTPQAALARARLPLAITHAPGCMLVTSLTNAQLAGAAELAPVPGSLV